MLKEDIKNSIVFLERATMTGREAYGWIQTYTALTKQHAELEAQEKLDAELAAQEAIELAPELAQPE